MFTSHVHRKLAVWLLAVGFALPCAAVACATLPGPAHVIQNAACNAKQGPRDERSGCADRDQLAGFTNSANAIVGPAVIAMAAIAPIACLVGAGALMFGNRRGLVIIGGALGTLVFVISIKGIVA